MATDWKLHLPAGRHSGRIARGMNPALREGLDECLFGISALGGSHGLVRGASLKYERI